MTYLRFYFLSSKYSFSKLLACLTTIIVFHAFSTAQSNISYGANLHDQISCRQTDVYNFEANKDDIVVVHVVELLDFGGVCGGACFCFDQNIVILDSLDNVIAENSSPTSGNSRNLSRTIVGPVRIHQEGAYRIAVRDKHNNGRGEYSIFLQNLSNPQRSELIEIDQKFLSNLNRGEVHTYNFESCSSGNIKIEMLAESGGVVPILELYNDRGQAVALPSSGIIEDQFNGGEIFTLLAYSTLDQSGSYSLKIECEGCPSGINIGNSCDDNNEATSNDLVQENCTCQGICTELNLKVGDSCDDNNLATDNDLVQQDCACQGICTELNLKVGDSCNDNNAATNNDLVQQDCTCQGICTELNLRVGDPCDDGDPSTINEVVGDDCRCLPGLPPPPTSIVRFYAGMAEGKTGETVLLPIIMEGLDSLSILGGQIIFSNPAILKVTDLQAGSISPLFNPDNGILSYVAPNGKGTPIDPQGDTLFWIELRLIGAPGGISLVYVPEFEIYKAYSAVDYDPLSYQSQDGKVTILDNFAIKGLVATYLNSGIAKARIELAVGQPNMVNEMREYTTQTDGLYEFTDIPVRSVCKIMPVKEENIRNGLLSATLILGQRFITGLPTPQITSPFQIFAGDVNCDLKLSSVDLILIQRVIVELDEGFENCRSWEFIPAEDSVNLILNSNYYLGDELPNYQVLESATDVEANFIGVKKGDMLNMADPANLQNPIIDLRSNYELPLEVFEVNKGNIVEMQIRPSINAFISSYNFELAYDKNQLKYLGLEEGSAAPLTNATENGTILMSWFNPKGKDLLLEKDQPLFTLQFIKRGNEYGKLQLKENRLEAIGFNQNLEKWTLSLDSHALKKAAFKLYQNQPNPFVYNTTISFELPEAMIAKISIVNSLGQLEKQYAGEYEKGYNSIVIPANSLPTGFYFYTLQAGDFIQTKQMLIGH